MITAEGRYVVGNLTAEGRYAFSRTSEQGYYLPKFEFQVSGGMVFGGIPAVNFIYVPPFSSTFGVVGASGLMAEYSVTGNSGLLAATEVNYSFTRADATKHFTRTEV